MKNIRIGSSDIYASEIALGCMRMCAKSVSESEKVIGTCVSNGINFFDHADIYGKGDSERIFGEAFKNLNIKREEVYIQSKCAIVPGKMYDFSKEHIISSVEGSLERLKTDYLDFLLLHRPDTLMEEEIGNAFDYLYTKGMVRYFGVSNHNPFQTELLQSVLHQKIMVNQVQFSLGHTVMIDAGFNVNMKNKPSSVRDGGIIEYSRMKHITIQPWSPMQASKGKTLFEDENINNVLTEMSGLKNITKEACAIAWILRHPAKMQPIIGTMNPERINNISKASDVILSREEWYHMYLGAGNRIP